MKIVILSGDDVVNEMKLKDQVALLVFPDQVFGVSSEDGKTWKLWKCKPRLTNLSVKHRKVIHDIKCGK